MIAQVVGVGARGDHVGIELAQEAREPAIQLALAEIAAVGLVAEVIGVGELLGADHAMADADRAGELLGLFQLAGGQAVGDGRHGDRGIAQGLIRGHGDDGAIHPARVGDRHPAVTAQGLHQPIAVRNERRVGLGPSAAAQGSPPSLTPVVSPRIGSDRAGIAGRVP